MISSAFNKLSADKQDRILNAAFKEFAAQGYELASTNRIVQEAGISKGMLFYYFESKWGLYCFSVDYGIDYMRREYVDLLDDEETDFLKKLKHASEVKLELYVRSPHLFNFMGSVVLDHEVNLPESLSNRLTEVQSTAYSKLFSNIDTTLFRNDLPAKQIVKLIQWSIDGYSQEITHRLAGRRLSTVDLKPHWEEFEAYLIALRKVYYQQEEATS